MDSEMATPLSVTFAIWYCEDISQGVAATGSQDSPCLNFEHRGKTAQEDSPPE